MLWEKEKLLVTSNFFFPHSVFNRLVQLTRKNPGLFGNDLTLNPLPNVKILDWSQLKAFADDTMNVTEKWKFLLVRVENMGKGENAGYQHFLLFAQCFQKASILGSLKVGIVW